MDNEQPHQELVKCVVVGDTAVGKTRLICARACNSKLDLSQFVTTHIPTVWAIDQYRIRKEVLERSWEVVDKVNVSLRLWDTFGDHEKDRRFAYGRSDVVLLCFSISNPISLRNCKAIWYPEIRKFCPNTPIVLVGCKNDLRHMYRDEKFLSLWQERSPFFRANHTCSRFPELSRPLRESDMLTPEQGRQVANEINAPYYETSVFTHYGVNEVFENVIRIALIARRQQRFWMTNLKPVQSAMLQKPFCPPQPNPPKVTVPPSQFRQHMLILLDSVAFTDIVLTLGERRFSLHKIVLASASPLFHRFLTQEALVSYLESSTPFSSGNIARSASDSSISSSVDTSSGYCNTDTESLIKSASKDVDYKQSNRSYNLQCAYLKTALWSLNASGDKQAANLGGSCLKRHASCTNLKDMCALVAGKPGLQRCLQHPLFHTISIECCANDACQKKSMTSFQSVLRLSKIITENALRQCLHYLYTGSLIEMEMPLSELQDAAELFDIEDLVSQLKKSDAVHSPVKELFQAHEEGKHLEKLRNSLKKHNMQSLFADVTFQFDDGICSAHKPILMARCDMMDAMFRGAFRESSAKLVQFPGVGTKTFQQFLHYIYSDELHPDVNASSCLSLLELANRLCLPRLIALVEEKVINELNALSGEGIDVTEYALKLLESCQMHNADQLADWCLYQISIHYKEITHKNIKLLRGLHPENQAYLNRNRWPPVWYLKELDFYERCMREKLMKKQPKGLKRHRLTPGCLCFSGKSKRKDRVDYSLH